MFIYQQLHLPFATSGIHNPLLAFLFDAFNWLFGALF
jgi:hypothetical protein